MVSLLQTSIFYLLQENTDLLYATQTLTVMFAMFALFSRTTRVRANVLAEQNGYAPWRGKPRELFVLILADGISQQLENKGQLDPISVNSVVETFKAKSPVPKGRIMTIFRTHISIVIASIIGGGAVYIDRNNPEHFFSLLTLSGFIFFTVLAVELVIYFSFRDDCSSEFADALSLVGFRSAYNPD